jgi:ABC-type glycerol-3-phosphate transport system substrate-binding protein
MAACDARPLYRIPTATPPGTPPRRRLSLWHADAVPGERVMARELLPPFAQARALEVDQLPHGDLDDLVRRVTRASAGGVGPDALQAPGEWLPDLVAGRLLRPVDPGPAAGWSPGLAETAAWQGQSWGVPAAPYFRQPFYNELLLRDAGLFNQGRTTPPTTWAEFADVSKRVARPDERWGSLLPSHDGDEELYLHVLQHLHGAGGEPPRREGTRVRLDTPPLREAVGYLLDLIQKSGALPLDRPPFRLAETGRAGLW